MIELNGELTCEKGEDGSWRDGTALDADICLYVQFLVGTVPGIQVTEVVLHPVPPTLSTLVLSYRLQRA